MKSKNRSKEQEIHNTMMKRFTKQKTVLLKFLIIFLQMIYKTKYKIIHGKEIKTLIPKKMFQKLLIAFAK